ncbi:oligosaccharide flippase family protein [Aestuariibaculum marinum]|uniref:Oligosaccharide flippase family protein n=1 Tax=Aestuariibaculum marinum TaxID=2683592 RepID=A0A8J6U385_9FLAO|nr:oligosaccharide flippase family protein [Aestuariibaculum marinum]MBD0823360.1 oligosaccharide flippase family protein [Aestuariibaculum marinum]
MLKNIHRDHLLILKNLSYLTLMKFFNIGFKFFIVAYLIRVLGDKNYGLVTWLDSIIQYFLMIINFGFNVYAAKYIVDHKEDKLRINEIVSSILIIKTVLFVLSILFILILSAFHEYRAYRELLLLFMFTGIGEVLFPVWFFQGKENLKPATLIVFFSRLFLIVATLFFVVSESDALIYIIVTSISSIIMGVLGISYMFKYYDVNFGRVSITTLLNYAKETFPFFLGRFLSLVFNFGTIFLIGKYCLLEQVAGFDLSLKIIMVSVIPFEMLQQAVFPTLARTKNKRMLKKLILASFFAGSVIGFVIFFFSSDFIALFGGNNMLEYTSALKVLSFLTPFVALTFILGSCGLVAFGYFREFNFSLIGTSVLYLFVLMVLYYFDSITFWNLVYLRVFGDILMCFIRMLYVIKKRVVIF